MKTSIFGMTSSRLPIMSFHFGRSGAPVLIVGGVHGNEPEGVAAAWALVERYSQNFSIDLRLTIVPQLNQDGVLLATRKNARGVDLNRNLPTKDWTSQFTEDKYNPGTQPNSEPENQCLVRWIDENKPKLILSLHSWHPLLNTNGACRPEAETIAKYTHYKIVEDIGYPTPGSLGTFCGHERDIPTLTYEVERGLALTQIVQDHVPAIHEALKISAGRFQ